MSKNSTSKEETTTKTEADQIWSEIKNKTIEMFALPDQKISHHCSPVTIEPSRLYVTTTATSVLPALEAALGPRYTIERLNQYLVISRSKSSSVR